MPFVVRCLLTSARKPGPLLQQGLRDHAAFPTRDEAEAERARLQRELRKSNPFRLWPQASLCDLTSLEPAILCDWLLDAAIDPPGPGPHGRHDWAAWWDASSPGWSDEQREHAWRALDRASGYEVVEVRPTRKLYVIMERGWRWDDEPPWTSGPETMRPHEAYSTRERAEERLRQLQAEKSRTRSENSRFEWTDLAGVTTEWATRENTAFYEIVEVEEEA